MLDHHASPRQTYQPTSMDDNCFPLTFATPGEAVVLREIRAGDRLRKRLYALGLNIGMTVRVVQSATSGPLILAVTNDARLAIGHGMAQKIMVSRTPITR